VLRPELEAVRARCLVDRGDVALGDAVAKGDQATCLVRCLRARVLGELGTDGRGHYHQTDRSIAPATSSESQKSAERYFQPPSASTQTMTPSSSSSASRSAAWITAPEETPPKMPSRSSSRRRPATDCSFETRSFRSSFET